MAGIGIVATIAVGWTLRGEPLEAATAGIITLASTPLAIIDFNEHRLPNRYTGPLAVFATVALIVLGAANEDLAGAATAIGIGAIGFAVFFALSLPLSIGMGDVKFAYPLAAVLAWFGATTLRTAALAMFLSAGVYTAATLLHHRRRSMMIPFGPFMAVGFVAGVLAGA